MSLVTEFRRGLQCLVGGLSRSQSWQRQKRSPDDGDLDALQVDLEACLQAMSDAACSCYPYVFIPTAAQLDELQRIVCKRGFPHQIITQHVDGDVHVFAKHPQGTRSFTVRIEAEGTLS